MIYENKETGEIVEAMQFDGRNAFECRDFYGEGAKTYSFGLKHELLRHLVIGTAAVPVGCYIIKNKLEECIWNQKAFESQFMVAAENPNKGMRSDTATAPEFLDIVPMPSIVPQTLLIL